MFEAADPDVFAWYVKNYGPDVNLFVDHCQIVQLECLRAGIWGTHDTWGRMLAYRDEQNAKRADQNQGPTMQSWNLNTRHKHRQRKGRSSCFRHPPYHASTWSTCPHIGRRDQ